MSPQTQSRLIMFVSILLAVGPHVPDLWLGSGMIVPNWLKFACALVGSIGTYVGFQLPSQKSLAAGDDGKNSSGGPGVTLRGTPHPGNTAPPAAAAFVAMAIVALCLAGCPNTSANTVNTVTTQALTVEGQVCLIDELADPLLPNGTALIIAAFVQNLCQKSIPQGLTALVAQIIDGIVGGSGPSVGDTSLLARLRLHIPVRLPVPAAPPPPPAWTATPAPSAKPAVRP